MTRVPKHLIVLTSGDRERLHRLLYRSSTTALQQRRARILLAADVGGDRPAQTDGAIAAATAVDPRTVARVRAEFARHGLERALCGRRPVFPPRRKLSDVQEAQVLVLAQSDPPAGRARWSLRLLADRLIELEVVESICPETVRQTLKKTTSSPGGYGPG
jgi:Homeodomain-like domain